MQRRLVLVSVVFFACVPLTPSQQTAPASPQPATVPTQQGPAPGSYSLQVNAQIVLLDVVVVNKKGEAVENLTQDDFTVYEDKTPQTIRTFEHISPPAVSAVVPINSTAELDAKEPNSSVSIIVMDEVVSKFSDAEFMRYSLKKYLATEGETLRQPMMLVAVDVNRMMVLRDYTTSKKEILEALDHHLTPLAWRGKSWQGEMFNASLAALTGVAHAAAGHPGHKNVIWIGRGFPVINWNQLNENPVAAARVRDAIKLCANELRDARVTLYTVDPAGLRGNEPQEQDADGNNIGDPLGGQVDFDTISTETGGRALHGENAVDHLIARSVRDGESFYTLSYKPATESQVAKPFRNIRVVMKDPSLTATTRKGYYTKATEVAPVLSANGKMTENAVRDLSVAGQGMMVYDGVPFTILHDAAASDEFKLKVKVADVAWEPGEGKTQSAKITLVVESFDKKGKVLNHSSQIMSLQVPALAEGVKDERTVSLPVKIATEAPAARVRFVVRANGSGKIGADNFFLVDRKTITDPSTGLQKGKVN
jgi:VWFA-related protein